MLKVEFEADSSDRQVIDLALDQILLLQPSCRILSKTISEIDGKVVNYEDLHSLNTSSGDGEPSSNGVRGDTYRPDYSHHDFLLLVVHRDINSHVDSYRPMNVSSSDALTIHPDRQQMKDHDIPTRGPLGTRYDALVDSMIFPTEYPQSSRPKRKKHRIEHYSPPPASRRDRSASPKASAGLRRSNRLRASTASAKETVWPAPGRWRDSGSSSGHGRKVSSDETHASRLEERRRNDDVARRRRRRSGGEVEPASASSLETLVPRIVAKDFMGGKTKFEKQQDREYSK